MSRSFFVGLGIVHPKIINNANVQGRTNIRLLSAKLIATSFELNFLDYVVDKLHMLERSHIACCTDWTAKKQF